MGGGGRRVGYGGRAPLPPTEEVALVYWAVFVVLGLLLVVQRRLDDGRVDGFAGLPFAGYAVVDRGLESPSDFYARDVADGRWSG